MDGFLLNIPGLNLGAAVSSKSKKQKAPRRKGQQESVFSEAWENMSNDLSKVMPDFLAKRLQGGKKSVTTMVIMAVVELAILGVIGKLVYDWFTS